MYAVKHLVSMPTTSPSPLSPLPSPSPSPYPPPFPSNTYPSLSESLRIATGVSETQTPRSRKWRSDGGDVHLRAAYPGFQSDSRAGNAEFRRHGRTHGVLRVAYSFVSHLPAIRLGFHFSTPISDTDTGSLLSIDPMCLSKNSIGH